MGVLIIQQSSLLFGHNGAQEFYLYAVPCLSSYQLSPNLKCELVAIQSNRPGYLLLRLVELYCLHHWHCIHSEGDWLAWIDWKQGFMCLPSFLAIPDQHRIHLIHHPSLCLFPTCCQIQVDREEIQLTCKMSSHGRCRWWPDHGICCDPICKSRLGMVLPYELLLLKPLLSYLPGLFFFLIPVALCIPTMTVLTVIFVRYVQQVDRRT